MISEYILYLLVLPTVVLWNIRLVKKETKEFFLEKENSIALKGMSAFFVIAAHYMVWGGTTNVVLKGIVGQLGGIGVLIFFFVSGYGIWKSYENRVIDYHYLVNRVKNVYFPYLCMKFILLAADYIFFESHTGLVNEIFAILLVNDWFIHVILILYFVFYFAAKVSKKNTIIISLIADGVLTVMYVYQDKPIGWFNALWLFTFGMVIAKYECKINKIINSDYLKWIVGSGCGFILTGCLFACNKGVGWANTFKVISGMFLCMCICLIMQIIQINSKFIMWAGKRSLQLYIIHIAIWNYLSSIEQLNIKLWLALGITIVITEIMYRMSRYIVNRGVG